LLGQVHYQLARHLLRANKLLSFFASPLVSYEHFLVFNLKFSISSTSKLGH